MTSHSKDAPGGNAQIILVTGATGLHGDVFGLVMRARGYFSNLGASLRTVAGGEVSGYTKLLTDSRNRARVRMWREARALGAIGTPGMKQIELSAGTIEYQDIAKGPRLCYCTG